VVQTNPFPATTGRICPHRCEDGCNRQQKDRAVSVGAIERFVGDWGLARGLKLDWYQSRERLERRLAPVADRLADLQTEVELGHGQAEILAEAGRCLSCGSCFGCENCWMYCTPGCMQRLPDVSPGRYFSIKMWTCDGYRKCAEECPSGVLDMI
jgi:NADPH-dependent glutamate synthase beta subunit-like oxidoreductase